MQRRKRMRARFRIQLPIHTHLYIRIGAHIILPHICVKVFYTITPAYKSAHTNTLIHTYPHACPSAFANKDMYVDAMYAQTCPYTFTHSYAYPCSWVYPFICCLHVYFNVHTCVCAFAQTTFLLRFLPSFQSHCCHLPSGEWWKDDLLVLGLFSCTYPVSLPQRSGVPTSRNVVGCLRALTLQHCP